MNKFSSLMALLLGISATAGCVGESTAQSDAPEVRFSQLHQGLYTDSGVMTDKKAVVFTTEDRYSDVLAIYSSEAAVAVNFDTSRVLLVDMGGRSTGGYAISVTSVEEFDDHVTANIRLVKPGPDCVVTQAFTNPYQFVLIQTSKEVLVSESIAVKRCG